MFVRGDCFGEGRLRGAYLLLASRDRQLPLPRIRYLGLQLDIEADEKPVVSRENFPRQVAESVGLTLGPLLAWWGLNQGGQDPDPLDLTVFLLSFLVLAAIPALLSPRAFRWTLLLSGSALLAFRIASFFLDTQPLAKDFVVALGGSWGQVYSSPQGHNGCSLSHDGY